MQIADRITYGFAKACKHWKKSYLNSTAFAKPWPLGATMHTFTTTYRSFNILFRKKIPYWNALLMGSMFVCCVFLLLLYHIMYPSNGISNEMRVAYYIIV